MAVDPVPHIETTPRAELLLQTFAGGGETGALMRAHDWDTSILGPVADWPQSLRIAVRILLGSGYPMLICWGSDYGMLYNDAYRPVLGPRKHPGALGRSCRDVFAEAWDFIGPLFDKVMQDGQDASTLADQLFLLDRNGYLEETYFTFSYSPIPDDDGRVGGVFVTALETTERVLEDRRRRVQRDLASATAEARTEEEVCRLAAVSAAEAPPFLGFLLLYLYSARTGAARLVASTGALGPDAAPPTIDCASDQLWCFGDVLATGTEKLITGLDTRLIDPPRSAWGAPIRTACVAPIHVRGRSEIVGFLVAGTNPRRAFDDAYRHALLGVADQVATGIAGARAYQAERQRAETLAELDNAKTVFFSNVSHEFRTPLTLMLGPLQEVLEETGARLSPRERDQLTVARRNAVRLLKLVNTLLDFSRIEAGRVQAVYEPLDLCALTAEIASVFRSAMEKAGLRFTIDCEEIGEPVYVDREMWEKIVLNLLSNAFKFTFEGEVALHLRPVDGVVELSVRDTGIGIPPDELPRVFDRFHRVESSRARTHEGTGIGLALVKELVRLHGGSVSVESAEGKGSTFRVTIPRGSSHLPAAQIGGRRTLASTALDGDAYVEEALRWVDAEQPSPVLHPDPALHPALAHSPATPAGEHRQSVLVVDDNADMRAYVTHLLAPVYDVHSASSGENALRIARRIHPALILTDIMMPGVDGFGLLRAVRSDPELRNTPVIVLSARAGEEARIEGLDAGADDYLVKPFTAREMLARVSAHIRIARLRDESARNETRLRAEAELERHRLQDLLTQIPAAVGLLMGPDHHWSYVNDHYIQATGRSSREDFVGRTVAESLPELDGQVFASLLDRVYRSGQPYTGREMMVRLNRGPHGEPEDAWFDFVYQPFRDSEGNVTGILVHAIDVSEKILARRLLEEKQAQLEKSLVAARHLAAIVESSDDAIASKNLQGIVTSWNSCAERLFGFTAAEMIGQSIRRIIPPEFQTDEDRILATIGRGDRIEHFETVRLHKDGRRIDVSLTISPIRDEEGRIVGASKIARDITERKRTQEVLRMTERLASVGKLAATIAHEINNPLEAATNLIYLARHTENAEQSSAFLTQAEEELNRVGLLTRQALGFYRETKGARLLRLGQLIQSMIALFGPKARNKSIAIHTEIRHDPEIHAIEGEVRSLIANLLNNAIDAIESRGEIRIRLTAAHRHGRPGVRLTIADTGAGIPPELRNRVFEPFFTTKKDVGTGLGLWISRGVVDNHHGSIAVRSSIRPNRSGTVFSIFLPAHPTT